MDGEIGGKTEVGVYENMVRTNSIDIKISSRIYKKCINVYAKNDKLAKKTNPTQTLQMMMDGKGKLSLCSYFIGSLM